MGTELSDVRGLPVDEAGIPKPLTQSLSQRDLEQHRAKVGMVCEMLSRKYDRFGWERMDSGMKALILTDFMDALQNYPLSEIREAARRCEARDPDRMPKESHIRREIQTARQRKADRVCPPSRPEPGPARIGIPSQEDAAKIMEAAGFTAKRFDAAKHNRMAVTWEQMEAQSERREMDPDEYMTADEIAAEDRRAAG